MQELTIICPSPSPSPNCSPACGLSRGGPGRTKRPIQRSKQVFTRSVLLDTVWGGHDEVYGNVVDLYVSYLRKKLDRDGEPSHIRTVRGVGYTFDSRPE